MVESSSTVVATERQAVFRLLAGWGKVWTAEDRAKVHLLTDTPPGTNNKQMAGQMWAGGDLGHRARLTPHVTCLQDGCPCIRPLMHRHGDMEAGHFSFFLVTLPTSFVLSQSQSARRPLGFDSPE